MLPISSAALALLQSAYPDLIRQIDALSAQNLPDTANASLSVAFSHFEEDFMGLYAFLWYATTHHVAVTILPTPLRRKVRPRQ